MKKNGLADHYGTQAFLTKILAFMTGKVQIFKEAQRGYYTMLAIVSRVGKGRVWGRNLGDYPS